MVRKRSIVSCLGLVLLLSGCSLQTQDFKAARNGPPATIEADAAKEFAERRRNVLVHIMDASGLEWEPQTPAEWRRFGGSAFGLAREQCNTYMAAIRDVNIARQQATQEINRVGTATAAVLGIARAAGQAVSLTATAFGLAESTVDNLAGGLLYELPPRAVSDLVRRLRSAYEDEIFARGDSAWLDRPTSFRTIQGYVELCSPIVIEARVADAIVAAQPVPIGGSAQPSGNKGVEAVQGTGNPPEIGILGAGVSRTSASGAATEPQTSRSSAAKTEPKPLRPSLNPETDAEKSVSAVDLRRIQQALCIRPDGNWRSTREAISLWQYDRGTGKRGTGLLDTKGLNDLIVEARCETAKYKSIYEKKTLPDPKTVRNLECRLEHTLNAGAVPRTDTLTDQVRGFILRAQALKGQPQTGIVTPELFLGLTECPDLP